ncbi:MAG TPA: heavy-metal-associated domain-containing protein [Puia sp.]|jgi:copper chaperone CopZ|nr:heavy-metal-associated domain-containing protein [Puia sp.]
METLQFKTNINCSGCVARVTPKLNEAKGIVTWKVDTNNPDKVLTVETDNLPGESVVGIVKSAGFSIQPL